MKRIWHSVVVQPLTFIFYGFFQPVEYSKNVEKLFQELEHIPSRREQFRRLNYTLFLPLCLSIFFFSLFTLVIFTLLSDLIYSQPFIGLLWEIARYFPAIILIELLIVVGIVFTLAEVFGKPTNSLKERREVYRGLISFPIMLNSILLVVVLRGFGENVIVTGLIWGLEGGIFLDTLIGVYFDANFRLKKLNLVKDNASRFARTMGEFEAYLMMFVGITFVISFFFLKGDIIPNIVGFGIFIICCIVGYYRLPFYLVSGHSFRKAYLAVRKDPSQTFTYLRSSSLHWDERVHLPLPYLEQTLSIAAQQDIKQAGNEIIFIVGKRSLQIRALRSIYPTIILRTLETCENLRDIANLSAHFAVAFSQKKYLIEPGQEQLFSHLSALSQQAAQYAKVVSRRIRINQLTAMQNALRAVLLDAHTNDEKINMLADRVVAKWRGIVQAERDRLQNQPQEIGKIENPYNPAIFTPGDSLFVGRQDVIQELESALNREDGIPPFLLNGERRIGKTSILKQLPTLLNPRYLPIIYDLQKPGISSSTARFLATLSTEINSVLTVQGIRTDTMEYKQLQKESKGNEREIYHVFDQWLGHLGQRLRQEDRTLLLAFDEFEKLAEAGKAQYLNLTLLLDWFRYAMQANLPIAFLFCGVHTFDEMSSESEINWLGSFVNVQMLRVSFLRPEEARQLITQIEPDSPSKGIFRNDVIDKIIRETGCHPFLIQAVCSTLINRLNSEKRIHAEMQDVTIAVDRVVEKWWPTYFRELWGRSTPEQQKCLALLKRVGEADISLIEQQSNLDTRTVRRTMQMLHRRDLVQHDQDGTYRIAVPIFGEWVERSLDNY